MSVAERTLDLIIAALADPCRRKIVDLLREKPRRAGELANATGTTPPIMSRHLRLMRESGIVEEQRPVATSFDARMRVYALRLQAIRELRAWLEATEGSPMPGE